jgi:CspA family cold shock protein
LNARQKRLFEESRKKNPDMKAPQDLAPTTWSEDDLALVKQGVGDKTARSSTAQNPSADGGPDAGGEQIGSVVTYFEDKGFGFLRPEGGGRDVFFHISRLAEGAATDLKPGAKVLYELGMDRTGKMAASRVRIPPPAAT